jgi:hypothetical protein
VIVATGSAFGSNTLAMWMAHALVGASVAVPATLGWLLACCGLQRLLARLPGPGRLACTAAPAPWRRGCRACRCACWGWTRATPPTSRPSSAPAR